MKMAPALRQLATTGLSSRAMRSRNATTPLVVARPATSTLILSVTGTPCSGPNISPRLIAASAVSAAASASSAIGSTIAFRSRLTLATRPSALSVASRTEISRSRIARASSVALHFQSSVLIGRELERRVHQAGGALEVVVAKHVLLHQERGAAVELLVLLVACAEFAADEVPGEPHQRHAAARARLRRMQVALEVACDLRVLEIVRRRRLHDQAAARHLTDQVDHPRECLRLQRHHRVKRRPRRPEHAFVIH